MSMRLIDMVWKKRHSLKLTPPESAVLVKIAAHVPKKKMEVNISISELSISTGYCERTIYRTIESLIKKRLIFKIVNKFAIKSELLKENARSNTYKINVPYISKKEEDLCYA